MNLLINNSDSISFAACYDKKNICGQRPEVKLVACIRDTRSSARQSNEIEFSIPVTSISAITD